MVGMNDRRWDRMVEQRYTKYNSYHCNVISVLLFSQKSFKQFISYEKGYENILAKMETKLRTSGDNTPLEFVIVS